MKKIILITSLILSSVPAFATTDPNSFSTAIAQITARMQNPKWNGRNSTWHKGITPEGKECVMLIEIWDTSITVALDHLSVRIDEHEPDPRTHIKSFSNELSDIDLQMKVHVPATFSAETIEMPSNLNQDLKLHFDEKNELTSVEITQTKGVFGAEQIHTLCTPQD